MALESCQIHRFIFWKTFNKFASCQTTFLYLSMQSFKSPLKTKLVLISLKHTAPTNYMILYTAFLRLVIKINRTCVPIHRKPNTFGLNKECSFSNRSSIPCCAKTFDEILSPHVKFVLSHFPLNASYCFT